MYHHFKNKTNNSSLQIPKTIIVATKFLQVISHQLTIRIAAFIFTIPPKFKTPKREIAMDESAQHKTLKIPQIKKSIHVLVYGYSDKKVLLVHGWAGRRTQLFMLANKLLEQGFMVIAFDAPAHGKSSGKRTNMMEYITSINALEKEFGPFEAAVGHSFGGMALVNAVSQKNIFKSLVTIGAADKVEDILSNFIKNLGLKENLSRKLKSFLESKWNVKIANFAVNFSAKKVKIPTLVVQDITDGDVAVSCALNIRQNLENGKLLITNGLGHTKIIRDKKTTNKIVGFIIKNTNK